ncbi:MAG: GAF domain-containing protein [Chloroflexi bacterium]|nr:GAF domain-containing protein [Chloroflexota bacterium]
MPDFINPIIDPGSELADVLDAILRDLSQVVEYEHVRILLLPAVLDVRGGSSEAAEDNQLITVRDLGSLSPLLASLDPIPLDRYPLNRLLMTMQKPIVISDTKYSDLWVRGSKDTLAVNGIRAWIGSPLVVKGESIGVLTLHSSLPQKYTERDGIVVFAFASQAAEAIDKVRLLDQAQSRLHAMMALYDASLDVIGQSQDPDRLLRTLVRRAVDLLQAEAGVIYLLEPDRATLRVAISHGFTDEYMGATLTIGQGLGGRVFESGQPLIVDDYQRWPGRADRFGSDLRFSAIMGVPLRWKDDVLGVLEICANSDVRRFGSQDRWLAELFANQVAIAMSNARLVEQSRRRLGDLVALRDISLQMTSTLDLNQVLDAICAHVLTLTGAEDTHIYLWDEVRAAFAYSVALWQSGERKPAVTQPRRDGLTDRVRRSGQAIVIDDAPRHELYSSPDARNWGLQSIAGFPLKRAGRVLGVFTVAFIQPHHFGEDELRVLNLLADQAAIVIENARLYEAMQYQLKLQSSLYQVITLLRSTLNVGEILTAVEAILCDLFQPQTVAIGLIDHARGHLTFPALIGGAGPTLDRPLNELPKPLVQAALAGEVLVLESLHDYPDIQQLYDLPADRSLLIVPVVGQRQTQGLITLVTHERPLYTAEQLEMIKALANQTAIAMDNALAYYDLQSALAEREKTQQALIRSESLAAVGQLVAGVAHELNNPLASVSSLVQSALETIGLPYSPSSESTASLPVIRADKIKPLSIPHMIELTEDLAFSLKELHRAKGIVSSLLDLSRQSSSYTEEISLTIVCQDALRILQNKLKSLPLEISEKYADDLPTVRGNFANLGQVALNIIENAAEAFEKKPGRIQVGTRFDAARERACFYISDNGPGIPADVLANIFHPFYTTKRVGVGTGLGLYISYEIIKKHGGEIVVETEVDKGTTFRVELPVDSALVE